MSKAASRLKKAMKKAADNVRHGMLKTNIPAGMATASPPLGPMLNERGIDLLSFVKQFNERTKDIKEGIPLPTRVYVNPDRTFELVINSPPVVYFLKHAAGIQRGAMEPGKEIAGKVTLKHVYEIAKIKQKDAALEVHSLQEICRMIINTAVSCGIQVVRDLDPKEYSEFLKERAAIIEKQKAELEEKREAKQTRIAE